MSNPKVFIASSVEGVKVAYAAQSNLEYDCDPTVWSQGVFKISSSPLDSLITQLENSDFAIFVFTPDDAITMRGNTADTVRDNVIFELGLFLGRLGKQRCFIITPDVDMHIPTDLIGVTPSPYRAKRDTAEIRAAIGPACNDIRDAIKLLGRLRPEVPAAHVTVTHSDSYDDEDKKILLREWLNDAQPDTAYNYHKVDADLKVDRGTTKRLLEVVVHNLNTLKICQQSSNLFMLEWPAQEIAWAV